MYKHILVPTDGSHLSEEAAAAAIRIAVSLHARITALHVVPEPTTHHVLWANASSGFSNPMTTAGDLILGGTAGAAGRLAKGSDGQVLTVDPTTHLPQWSAPGGGAMTNLGTIPLDSVVSWTAIPGTYKALVIDWMAYSTVTTPGQGVIGVQFNADTGANYGGNWQENVGSAATISQVLSGTSIVVGEMPDKTNITTPAGAGRIVIPAYADTTLFKALSALSSFFRVNSNGGWGTGIAGGGWASTAAITQVTIVGYGAFGAGSKATLYGIS